MQFSKWGDGSNLCVLGEDRLEGLVITHLESAVLLEAAMTQRSDPRYGIYPLYATRPRQQPDEITSAVLDHLLDGYVETAEAAGTAARTLWSGIAQQTDLPIDTPDARLMSYLALRRGYQLAPVRDWRSRELYRYPLLEAFGASADGELLGLLQQRGMLRRTGLIERLRLCPACQGAHLLFVDACPNCHGLEIEADESIHCFTCGHVASQRAFSLAGGLQCPNCRARLRHIGTEYDRPLEHHHCKRCAERFTEAEVITHCGICEHESRPELLITREVGRYEITEYGRIRVLNQDISTPLVSVERNGSLHPQVFEQLLGWQSEIAAQHPECHFTLLHIQLKHLEETSSLLTPEAASRLLRMLSERLPSLVRPGDVCTRTQSADFWVLMPQADPTATKALIEQLQALFEASDELRAANLRFSARALESGHTSLTETSGNALMRKLAEQSEEVLHA